MSEQTPDMNIKNWSIEDIMQLFEVDDLNPTEITQVADRLIDKSITDENTAATTFLTQAKDKLLNHIAKQDELGNYSQEASSQLKDWWQNQYLTQNNSTQADKATTRQNHIQTFDNDHFQMKRETLGINQTYDVGVAQGTINPNLKNIIERTVIIDSQYRPNIFPYADQDITAPSYGSSYTANLSDPLKNVISLELYSVQIPKTWYNISSFIGNSCFEIYKPDAADADDPNKATYDSVYNITSGYYTPNLLVTNWTNLNMPGTLHYDSTRNRIGIESGTNLAGGDFIIWYGGDQCKGGCTTKIFPNNNLGWTLGFRKTVADSTGKIEKLFTKIPSSGGITWAEAAPQLSGPQYMLLTLDDYNHNRLNKAIISTVQGQTKLDLPSYYNPLSVSCETDSDDENEVFAVKTAPRQLTAAQLFTINSIKGERNARKVRANAPTSNNVLAVIPIPNNTAYGDNIVLFGQDMSTNARDYFGPVTIERIKTELLDDKGNLIDLNGSDWSFTFRIKQLYQY